MFSGSTAQADAVGRYVHFNVGVGGDGKREKIYMYSVLKIADESINFTTLCQ